MASSALIALVLLGVGLLIYRSIAGLITDTSSVTHTHIVIQTLSETLSLLKDVHASQRGFVITGQENYLEPYRTALPKIAQDLKKLDVLTADNASQQPGSFSSQQELEGRHGIACSPSWPFSSRSTPAGAASSKRTAYRRDDGSKAASNSVLPSGETASGPGTAWRCVE